MGFSEASVQECIRRIAKEYQDIGQPRHIQGIFLDGRTVDLHVSPMDTMLEVRNQFSQHLGITSARLRLVVGTTMVQDFAQTVAEQGVTDGAVVTIVVRDPLALLGGHVDPDARAHLMAQIREGRAGR